MSPVSNRPELVRKPHEYRRGLVAFLALPAMFGLAVWAASQFRLERPMAVAAASFDEGASEASEPPAAKEDDNAAPQQRVRAPELEGGVAWLNAAGPIHLRDLRGKIVILDFWTLCCINCIHTLPDLAKLEKKYPNELAVIGVHSAKFDNEKNSESIRKAILRYEISHPVVNDANMRIWRSFGVRSWPTLVLIDPEGYYLGHISGEGHYQLLYEVIGKLIKMHREKKTLVEGPLHFDLARFRERGTGPLYFPGKILADEPGKRLFIADSTHHRIVITDLDGKKIAVAGTGAVGRTDGTFEQATFNDPQGMALRGDMLYVADRKNHLLRVLDLKALRADSDAIKAALASCGRTLWGYLVTESTMAPCPHFVSEGGRVPGVTQWAINDKPAKVALDDFYREWAVHSKLSFDLHPTRQSYIRNAVARRLTAASPTYLGIVLERFPSLDDFTDESIYFGDRAIVKKMFEHVPSFYDFGTAITGGLSEYRWR